MNNDESGKPLKKAIEIYDAEIDFVSLVDKAANKRKFLIMKQERMNETMTQNIKKANMEKLQKALTEELTQAVLQIFENAGIIKDGEFTGGTVQKGEQHFLHGIL